MLSTNDRYLCHLCCSIIIASDFFVVFAVAHEKKSITGLLNISPLQIKVTIKRQLEPIKNNETYFTYTTYLCMFILAFSR